MKKQAISLLLLTLIFTGCVERGFTVHPMQTKPAPLMEKASDKTKKCATKKQSIAKKIVKEDKTIAVEPKIESTKEPKMETPIVEKSEQPNTETNSFFTLSDETKNNISGFFIILIGFMILL